MKKLSKKINIIVEKTDTGLSAYCHKYSIFTTGTIIPELLNNALEAFSLYFEDEDTEVTQDNLTFEIDFKQFFQYFKVLNGRFLSKKIGMNPSLLSQYVQSRKNHPINKRKKFFMEFIRSERNCPNSIYFTNNYKRL